MTAADELARILVSLCREAGAELRRRFDGPRTVVKKGAVDLVTDADEAAEELIVRGLQRAFPGAPILAEESGRHGEGGALRFIVDPLDGTTNYARGVPHYATTIAALDERGLLAGCTLDPSRDELFLGVRGEGATLNGARLQVNRGVRLDDAVLATGFPYDVRTQGRELFARFERLVTRSRAVRRFGSAALDLAWVAAGRYDGYWERGLKPWDLAAGLLLVREAGGVALDYAGREATVDAGEGVAAAPALAAELVTVLSEG